MNNYDNQRLHDSFSSMVMSIWVSESGMGNRGTLTILHLDSNNLMQREDFRINENIERDTYNDIFQKYLVPNSDMVDIRKSTGNKMEMLNVCEKHPYIHIPCGFGNEAFLAKKMIQNNPTDLSDRLKYGVDAVDASVTRFLNIF